MYTFRLSTVDFIHDEKNYLRTAMILFSDGMEMSVYLPE